MLEHVLKGTKNYWGWIYFLSAIIIVGFFFYLEQTSYGLGITGLSRNVTWGFYIAQFTFLVGVAASGVMVVLPYYLHDFKAFGKLTILGEFLAISSVVMCMLFIFVDMGQPFNLKKGEAMAAPSDKLAQSLEVLKALQDQSIVAIRTKSMTRTHRERLLKNGFIKEVMKGWYIPSTIQIFSMD